MLRELHISNLAVISDARIELSPGLNCFTGATGAGKSLVIGALEVLLGFRSPTEMMRPGADEGRVSGLFEIVNVEAVRDIAAVTDVDLAADGGELLLTRKLYASGRSSVALNGQPITLSMLKLLAERLVDVHGQHDHQYLLKPSNQIDVVDQFGQLLPLRGQYRAVYEQLASVRAKLAELTTGANFRKQQIDLYQFQANEIDAAELDPAEYAELQARESVLINIEKLKKDAGAVHASLYESDGSVLDRLKMMVGVLGELLSLDASLGNVAGGVRDATIGLEEAAYDLSRYLDKLDLDPGELAEVSDRLNTINRVLNKYGNSVESVLQLRAEIGAKLDTLQNAGVDASTLQRQIDPLERELDKLGKSLSEKRTEVAGRLGPLIQSQLGALGMEKATFKVQRLPATGPEGHITATGFDQIEFVARTNPGQLEQPLRKIASGGEMSRIMLALKGVLAQSDRVSVLVFDEIDANVGGRLGSIIGDKLRQLATHHQVLCITHLPQIASYADRHFTVRKEVVDGKTESRVRVMDGEERLEELAEMISGNRITETTRAQAKELLEMAKRVTPEVAKIKKAKPAKAASAR